jgi:hypothetical protein
MHSAYGATEIHEFSTGIKWAQNGRGGWVSQGFTGGYMNSTLPEIPYNVQRAIANNLFSVSEGVSTQFPTLVARVVPPTPREEKESHHWSVLAVVSRGQDDYGRSFSAYRYFLCEGEDKLAAILEFFRQQRQVLTFNPQEKVDRPHSVSLSTRPRRDLSPLLSSPPVVSESPIPAVVQGSPIPVVVQGSPIQFPGTVPGADDRQLSPTSFQPTPTDSIALIDELFKLHNYAQSLRHPQSDLAWAYNVHSLERPADFWVIHAASPQAYDLLTRIRSQPVSQRRPIRDEQAIKSAVQGLISRDVIKPEHVRSLIPAWADSDPTDPNSAAFWRQVFEAQGATQALRQNIRNPQMVRLLTLRAILCPDTFPEYLNWLQPSLLTSRPKSELQATAEQFLRGPWSSELQQLKDQNPEIAEVLDESRRKALGAVVKAFPNAAPQATSALWAWAMPRGFWKIQPQGWDGFFEPLQGVQLSPALEKFCLEVGRELQRNGQPFYQIAAACRAYSSGGRVEAKLYDDAFGPPSEPREGVPFLGLEIYRKPTLTERIKKVWEDFLALTSTTGFRQVSAGVATVLIVGFVWQILSKPSLLGEESITLDLDHCFLPEAEPEPPAGGESNQSQASTTEAQPPLQTTLASIFNPEQQTSLGRLLCLAEGSRQWFVYAPSPSEAELSTAIARYQQGLGFDNPDGKIEADGLTATLLSSDVDFHPYRLVLDTTLNSLSSAAFLDRDTAIRAIATALTRDSNQALTDYDLAVRLDFNSTDLPSGESLKEPRPKAQTEWKNSLDDWSLSLNENPEFSDQNLETVARTLIQEVQYSTTVEAINLLFNSEQIPGYTDEDEQRLKNTIVKVLGLKAYPLEPDSPDNKKALLDRVEAYNSKDERSQVRMFFSSSPNPATVSSDAATNFEAFKAEVQREFNRSCLRPIQRQFCTPLPPNPPTP